ncbi:MAG: hypothetical protein PHO01_12225 [Desulfotomaculaceae bacterium]|nr:hypothetical protein [Desulfotomaculaceae bacterium]
MNAETFRQTERLFNRYYKKKMRIERLHMIIGQLNEQAEEMKVELAAASPVPRVIAVYQGYGGVGGGHGGGGGAGSGAGGGVKGLDVAIERYGDLMVNMWTRYLEIKRRIWTLKVRVGRLEEEVAAVDDAVTRLLDDEERLIIEQRYVYRRSNYTIGKVMNRDERTIRRKHQAIIKKVAYFLAKT